MCRSIFGLSMLSHWSVCLSLRHFFSCYLSSLFWFPSNTSNAWVGLCSPYLSCFPASSSSLIFLHSGKSWRSSSTILLIQFFGILFLYSNGDTLFLHPTVNNFFFPEVVFFLLCCVTFSSWGYIFLDWVLAKRQDVWIILISPGCSLFIYPRR